MTNAKREEIIAAMSSLLEQLVTITIEYSNNDSSRKICSIS